MAADSWFRRSLLFSGSASVLAATLGLLHHAIPKGLQSLYPSEEAWQAAAATERLRLYVRFAPFVGAAGFLWSAAVWKREALRKWEPPPAWRLLVGAAFLGAGVLAYHFSTREWSRFGRPCWDSQCLYAELLHAWITTGAEVAGRDLAAFMRSDYHANSPLPPLLVALLMIVTPLPAVAAFRLASALAVAGTLLLVGRCLLRDRSRLERLGVLLLLATHLILIRSSFFPQTDSFVLLWTTALLVVLLRRLERATWMNAGGTFVLLTSGLFVKLSFLPALMLPPLWSLLWHRGEADRLKRAAYQGVLFSLLPYGLYLLFQQAMDSTGLYAAELAARSGFDSNIWYVSMSAVHAGGLLSALIVMGGPRRGQVDRLLAAWVVLYVLSLWASRVSGWDRFYLSLLPALGVLAGHGLVVVRERGGVALVGVLVGLYALLNILALGREASTTDGGARAPAGRPAPPVIRPAHRSCMIRPGLAARSNPSTCT